MVSPHLGKPKIIFLHDATGDRSGATILWFENGTAVTQPDVLG
jgi:hypothetical protein